MKNVQCVADYVQEIGAALIQTSAIGRHATWSSVHSPALTASRHIRPSYAGIGPVAATGM